MTFQEPFLGSFLYWAISTLKIWCRCPGIWSIKDYFGSTEAIFAVWVLDLPNYWPQIRHLAFSGKPKIPGKAVRFVPQSERPPNPFYKNALALAIGSVKLESMKYITDIHALNLPCSLGTSGDWHTSAIQWQNLHVLESDKSPFGDWGIEVNSAVSVPENPDNALPIANHVRALLDMIEQGRFTVAQGMNGDYLDDDSFSEVIFEKVSLLKSYPNWHDIDCFMARECRMAWVRFKKDACSNAQKGKTVVTG